MGGSVWDDNTFVGTLTADDLAIDSPTLIVDETNNRLGIGTATPRTTATVEGAITLKEQASADADTAAYGQVWVKTATPNQLFFTTDAGDDIQLTSGTATAFVGDITGVTAGDGLTGGGTTGALSIAVGAGTGIDVATDAISVDVSDFMANGADNYLVTATGTDAMNAEANLQFDGTGLKVKEAANAAADTVAYGQIWVKNTAPCELYFTTDAGNDIQLTSGTAIAGGGSVNNDVDLILHMQVFS